MKKATDLIRVILFLQEVRSDCQLDPTHQNFCGFLNLGHMPSDEFIFFVGFYQENSLNKEFANNVIKQLGMEIEGGTESLYPPVDVQETIFHLLQ